MSTKLVYPGYVPTCHKCKAKCVMVCPVQQFNIQNGNSHNEKIRTAVVTWGCGHCHDVRYLVEHILPEVKIQC